MTARRGSPHCPGLFAFSLLLFACVSCQRREAPAASAPNPNTPREVEAASEMHLVGQEFHVLRSMILEHRRLQTATKTDDTRKKSDLLQVEIGKLARKLDTAQQEMNPEERRIVTEGLSPSTDEN